jgi:hypothetical protein
MVSMCPYKWALYAISVWAALYVLLEAAMAWRDAHARPAKPGYEPGPLLDDGDEEVDEEEEEDVRLEGARVGAGKVGWERAVAGYVRR